MESGHLAGLRVRIAVSRGHELGKGRLEFRLERRIGARQLPPGVGGIVGRAGGWRRRLHAGLLHDHGIGQHGGRFGVEVGPPRVVAEQPAAGEDDGPENAEDRGPVLFVPCLGGADRHGQLVVFQVMPLRGLHSLSICSRLHGGGATRPGSPGVDSSTGSVEIAAPLAVPA